MSKLDEDVAEIRVDVKWVKATLQTHMGEHFRVRILMAGAFLAAACSLAVAFIV
jgi:hypothetical protein